MGMRNGRNKQKLFDVQTRTKEQDTQIDYMTKSSQSLNIETRDLKGLNVYSPCDNLFKSSIDIPRYKKHFFNIYGAPYPSLSNIRLMDQIKYMSVPEFLVFSSYQELVRIHISTVNLLIVSYSEFLIAFPLRNCLPAKNKTFLRQVIHKIG